MSTFLLVPGAGLGADAFTDVVAGLTDRGHDAGAISLRGLGDRHDDADPMTDLHDHVADVVAAVGSRSDVVLLGHSYAASVVWEAMPQLAGRVAHVVLLGATPPPAGSSAFDLLPPEGREMMTQLADAHGGGWRLPPMQRDLLDAIWGDHGFDDASYARYLEIASGHPLATLRTPMTTAIDAQITAHRTHLVCLGDPYETPALPAPWERVELATGHWPMLTAPKVLTDALDELTA